MHESVRFGPKSRTKRVRVERSAAPPFLSLSGTMHCPRKMHGLSKSRAAFYALFIYIEYQQFVSTGGGAWVLTDLADSSQLATPQRLEAKMEVIHALQATSLAIRGGGIEERNLEADRRVQVAEDRAREAEDRAREAKTRLQESERSFREQVS